MKKPPSNSIFSYGTVRTGFRSHDMNRRITLQTKVETQSDTGFVTVTWAHYLTIWANVKPVRGREYLEADKVNAETMHWFLIRYRRGLSPTMRIIYENRNYDIIEIQEVGNREGTKILAKAVMA